jgi:hypothetical protein
MNTKVILTGVLAFAAAAVTSVVIGRYGDEFAGFLRIDVLTGFAFVATLVALITLEYGRGAGRAARQPVALRSVSGGVVPTGAAKIVALSESNDTRAAA